MAGRLQLAHLCQNLLSNAIKFRGAQPPDLHVAAVDCAAEEHTGERRFAVRDNGIDIEPPYCERVFVIFQRRNTRKEYPGAGIGPAICKKIVECHGEHIWVESESRKGSTFFFTIPDRR